MNTRLNPQSAPPKRPQATASSAKKQSKKASKRKPASAKKPTSKKRKEDGSNTLHINIDWQKRQKQTTLTETIRRNTPEPSEGIASNEEKSVSTSMADTSTTFLDTEALQLEEDSERRQNPSSRWMSPSTNIVSIGIRRSSPSASSVGKSTIRPSSSASQQARAMTPIVRTSGPSFTQVSSPLRFETTNESLSPMTQESSANQKLSVKPRYSSRSILGPGDLKITAVLESTCRMMEKYLLSRNPFPTEAELLAVMRYSNSQSI